MATGDETVKVTREYIPDGTPDRTPDGQLKKTSKEYPTRLVKISLRSQAIGALATPFAILCRNI